MSSNNESLRKRVLFAVLDWGLGHATRSIPVIRKLRARQCDVMIASSGDSLKLLKSEFPDYLFFELSSYNAQYSKSIPLMLKLLVQVPKFLSAMRKEHLEVKNLARENNVDIIISDNRYGCWAKGVRSVFITHQVNLIMPKPLRWLEPLVKRKLNKWISRFDEVWIPDDKHKLTGKLTRPEPRNFRFIGVLSRFVNHRQVVKNDYDFVAVLSGPEPQRTQLEELVIKGAFTSKLKALIIRGVYEEEVRPKPATAGITLINHCNSTELEEIVQESKVIVCRSGYSSIMDLAFVQKDKVLFVPTPGQTEQEYLAQLLFENRVAPFQRQEDLDLIRGLEDIESYSGFVGWTNDSNLLDKAIGDLLK
ncbi:MAG: glycosyltransferase [Cyclobacteriaceae bacterium]